jgi:hypothetical protein
MILVLAVLVQHWRGGRKGRIFSNHSALNSAAGIAKVALIMFLAFFIEKQYKDTPFLGNCSLKNFGLFQKNPFKFVKSVSSVLLSCLSFDPHGKLLSFVSTIEFK